MFTILSNSSFQTYKLQTANNARYVTRVTLVYKWSKIYIQIYTCILIFILLSTRILREEYTFKSGWTHKYKCLAFSTQRTITELSLTQSRREFNLSRVWRNRNKLNSRTHKIRIPVIISIL